MFSCQSTTPQMLLFALSPLYWYREQCVDIERHFWYTIFKMHEFRSTKIENIYETLRRRFGVIMTLLLCQVSIGKLPRVTPATVKHLFTETLRFIAISRLSKHGLLCFSMSNEVLPFSGKKHMCTLCWSPDFIYFLFQIYSYRIKAFRQR